MPAWRHLWGRAGCDVVAASPSYDGVRIAGENLVEVTLGRDRMMMTTSSFMACPTSQGLPVPRSTASSISSEVAFACGRLGSPITFAVANRQNLQGGRRPLRMLERYGHVRDTEVRRAVSANAQHVEEARTKTPTVEKTAAGNTESSGGGNSKPVTQLRVWRPQRVPRQGATRNFTGLRLESASGCGRTGHNLNPAERVCARRDQARYLLRWPIERLTPN